MKIYALTCSSKQQPYALSSYWLLAHKQIAYLRLYQSLHIFRYAIYTSVTHIRYAKPVTHFIRRPLRSYAVTHFIPDRRAHRWVTCEPYYTNNRQRLTTNYYWPLLTVHCRPFSGRLPLTFRTANRHFLKSVPGLYQSLSVNDWRVRPQRPQHRRILYTYIGFK